MIRIHILLLLLLTSAGLQAQINYEVKVMSWNVLNWPSTSNTVADTSNRCPSYRTVVNYVQPDILVTMENTSANSINWFRDQVMNTGGYHYASGTFINGPDTDNGIFFRDSLFDFVSNTPVNTSLRDISQFTVIFKPTGDTLHIFALHLKASQGYELQRASEVADLRQVTNAFPAGTNFLVAGDFNIYYETEPAYTGLLQDNANDDGNLLDVLSLGGTWNNPAYAPYHTQSTHLNSTGGFSGGGMNDRFDMILYSNGVAQPGGVYYMPGTYQNIGNDGNHFDKSINNGTNSAVPSNVANALYNTSDHLPIVMNLMIGPNSGIAEISSPIRFANVFPNPANESARVIFSSSKPVKAGYIISDHLGRILVRKPAELYETGENLFSLEGVSGLKPGSYLLSLSFDNELINKQLVVIK